MRAEREDERQVRVDRARLSLDGLSVGDAFGERFFGALEEVVPRIAARALSAGPWRYTDDTEMALSIMDQLEEHGAIEQDDLARRFAERMDVSRGYGRGAFEILDGIRQGRTWHSAASSAFRGMGSFGNGAAMRVAPIGAYFADDLERVVREASRSAEVTHAHPEGVAGAVAIAIAAATCASTRPPSEAQLLSTVLEWTPRGYTYDGIQQARDLAKDCGVVHAAKTLGNGSGVTAPDTVPLCLWLVAHHRESSYEDGLWATVSALGDRDTTCAIVGGVLALRRGVAGIPAAWLSAREPLPANSLDPSLSGARR